MGTITERRRKDGTCAYTAQIRLKKDGKLVHTEAQTFNKRKLAEVWLVQRETELEKGIPQAVTIGQLIQRTLEQEATQLSRQKTCRLTTMLTYPIHSIDALKYTTKDIVAYIRERGKTVIPSTVKSDLSFLRQIMRMARAEWGYAVDLQPLDDAIHYAHQQGLTGSSFQRTRRLSQEEEQQLLDYFHQAPHELPMADLMLFAIASCRRLGEITRIQWDDLQSDKKIILVREVKHPRFKKVNHKTSRLTDEALSIIHRQPRNDPRIFPYRSESITMAWWRATRILGIDNLHFHDLRHEGVSRLFERGYAIHEVALFSLHQDWKTLQRYTHLKPEDLPDR